MSIVSVYIAAVKASKSAVVAYTGNVKEGLASKPTIELMLAYSIVPLDATGKVASKDNAIAYVAMPHVLARSSDNAGETTMRAMQAAGFKGAGFAGKDSTPDSRRKAAEALATKLAPLMPASKPAATRKPASKPAAVAPASQPAATEVPAT